MDRLIIRAVENHFVAGVVWVGPFISYCKRLSFLLSYCIAREPWLVFVRWVMAERAGLIAARPPLTQLLAYPGTQRIPIDRDEVLLAEIHTIFSVVRVCILFFFLYYDRTS